MSKHKWHYVSDAKTCMHGNMICNYCHKTISTGPYRYRETEEAYLSQHKDCSLYDPQWRVIEAERRKREAHYEEFLKECLAFREKWNIDDLDDLIENLKEINR